MKERKKHSEYRKPAKLIVLSLAAALFLNACGSTAAAMNETEKQQLAEVMQASTGRPAAAGADQSKGGQSSMKPAGTQTEESAAKTELPQTEQTASKQDSSASGQTALTEETSLKEQTDVSDQEETNVVKNDAYGAKMTDEFYKTGKKNTVISPLSINLALAMALEGANGQTQKEIENYLGVKKDDLDPYITSLMAAVSEKEGAKAVIANAFWYLTGLDVNDKYIKTLKDRYAAEVSDLDFTNPAAAAEIINSWCSEHTNGLIPSIVSPGDLQTSLDVILNTVYFKGDWQDPYDTSYTEPFFGFEEETEAELLYSEETTYYENDKATAFAKPYKEKYSFVGILPKEEGEFDLSDLDIGSLLKSKTNEYEVHAVMPKLDVESGGSLSDILKSMGICQAFSADADFSGIADNIAISDVIHKTKLILDETGTEAAAATAIVMLSSAMPMQTKQIKEVRLDRPYAFMIVDNETGTALFTGKIVEP